MKKTTITYKKLNPLFTIGERYEPSEIKVENINNFESETFEEHADIFDVAASSVPAYGAVRSIASSAGKIFGIGTEDKSQTGYNAYVAANPNLPWYPTQAEILAAGKLGSYENGAKFDGGQPASVVASYDPSQGYFKSGDWVFKVISTSPIKWKMFKGAKEQHTFSSSLNAKNPAIAPQPIVNNVPTAIHTSNMPNGSAPGQVQTNTTQTQSSPAMPSSNQTPQTNSDGTIKVDSNGKTVFQNAGSGAADLSSIAKNIPGGNTTLVVGAIMVIVIVVILFIANKN